MIFNPTPINEKCKMRDTKWVMSCPNCQCERIISYCQAWNIKKNICIKECKPCARELGIILTKTDHLYKYVTDKKIQEKSTLQRIGIKRKKTSILLLYRNLFDNSNNYESTKIKMREAKIGKFGKLAGNWRGGQIINRKLEMGRDKYKQLRKTCFQKDDYTCQICSVRGGSLEMDHIKEWCNYIELRYVLNNVRTLCKKCHKTTVNYGTKAIKKKINAIFL